MFYMRRKFLLSVGMAVGVSIIAGCASPARVGQMTAAASELKASLETPLRGNVSVGAVRGGKETNPMMISEVDGMSFQKALEASLLAVGLFSSESNSRYRLSANLLGLDQPVMGASMTVTAIVNYELVEKETGKTLYKETIALPYTASFSDALMGVERLRLANEGAVRTNISKLIDDLFIMNVKNVAIN